jgi:hypothetical protein
MDRGKITNEITQRHGTDKLAGRVAGFFVAGVSEHEIVFTLPGDPPAPEKFNAANN